MRKRTHENQKCKDAYQQKHVYFVNIACKSIMITMLIVTRVASQYYFFRTFELFVCVLIPISGVFKPYFISLIAISSFAIEVSCKNLVKPHSVFWKLASAVLTLIYKTKYDLIIALFYKFYFSIPHVKRRLLN